MTITEIKTEFVLATLGKGTPVIMCDFATMRMVNCGDMTVNSIVAFMAKDSVKFFTVTTNE